MHAAEQPNGPFFRPRIAGPGRSRWNATGAAAQVPSQVHDAIWHFLEQRACLLMTAPGIDRRTYADHPAKDSLSAGEEAAIAAVNTYSDAHHWPPRWTSRERHLSDASPKGKAYRLLSAWLRDIRRDRANNGIEVDVLDALENIIHCVGFASNVHVAFPLRSEPDAEGCRRETIEYRTLREDVPYDLACFISAAHNAVIEMLHWLDQDIPQRDAAFEAQLADHRRLQEISDAEHRLFAREKRHIAAVKRAKAKLAAQKAEAEQLMADAKQRMAEGMALAALAQGRVVQAE